MGGLGGRGVRSGGPGLLVGRRRGCAGGDGRARGRGAAATGGSLTRHDRWFVVVVVAVRVWKIGCRVIAIDV